MTRTLRLLSMPPILQTVAFFYSIEAERESWAFLASFNDGHKEAGSVHHCADEVKMLAKVKAAISALGGDFDAGFLECHPLKGEGQHRRRPCHVWEAA